MGKTKTKKFVHKVKELRESGSNISDANRGRALEKLKHTQIKKQEDRNNRKRKKILADPKYTESQRRIKLANLEENLEKRKKKILLQCGDISVGELIHEFNALHDDVVEPNSEGPGDHGIHTSSSSAVFPGGPAYPVSANPGATQASRLKRNQDVQAHNTAFSRLKVSFTRIQKHPNVDDSDVEDDVMSVNQKFAAFCDCRDTWRREYEQIMMSNGQQENVVKDSFPGPKLPKKGRKRKNR